MISFAVFLTILVGWQGVDNPIKWSEEWAKPSKKLFSGLNWLYLP